MNLKNSILPSLTLKYKINEKQNLRLGVSKTYTLPQFKERALFMKRRYRSKVGNRFMHQMITILI
jgi:hypothetical protein